MRIHWKNEHCCSSFCMHLRNLLPLLGPAASMIWTAGFRPQWQKSSSLPGTAAEASFRDWTIPRIGRALYSAWVMFGSSRVKLHCCWWLNLASIRLVLWLRRKLCSSCVNLWLLNSSLDGKDEARCRSKSSCSGGKVESCNSLAERGLEPNKDILEGTVGFE